MIVCGYPRSGTSLMLMLLAGSVTNYRVKADREHKRLDQQYVDGVEVIVKGPHLLMLKPQRPVILVRDPRAVITSTMGRHVGRVKSKHYFCGMYDCKGRKARSQGVMQMSWVLMQYLAGHRDGLIAKYEDLIRDPDYIQTVVGDYWGLMYDRKWSEYPSGWNDTLLQLWDHKLNGARPVHGKRNWENPIHRERIREQFRNHPELQELLELLGYEENDLWLDRVGIERPHWLTEPAQSDAVVVQCA